MLNRTLRIAPIGALTALVALATACEQVPLAPEPPRSSQPLLAAPIAPATSALASADGGASRFISEDVHDLTGFRVDFPCGDGFTEEIDMHGQLYWRATVLADAAGGLHSVLQTMPIGTGGVGVTTGAVYRIAWGDQAVFNRSPMGEVGRYEQTLRLAAPDIGVRAQLVIGGRFTVNANGQVVVERPIVRAACSI